MIIDAFGLSSFFMLTHLVTESSCLSTCSTALYWQWDVSTREASQVEWLALSRRKDRLRELLLGVLY